MDLDQLRIRPIDDQKTSNKEPKILPTHPFSMSLVAAKGSGKTTLLANLLTKPVFYQGTFDRVIIMCPTAKADDKYAYIMDHDVLAKPRKIKGELPDKELKHKVIQVKDGSDEKDTLKINPSDLITDPEDFIPFLKKVRKEYTEIFEKDGKKALPKTLLLLDDCLGLDILRNRTLINWLANTRHLNTSVIISLQRWNSIPKTIRLNCTYAIIFPIWDATEIKTIYDENGSKFSFKQFQELIIDLFDASDRRAFLCINNANPPSHRFIDSFQYFLLKG